MINEIQSHIALAEGFQYSVNISYDLNREEKIKSLIPTNASLELMEDILLSTYSSSTDRARVLVGAYGKGKSHIILVLLSLLFRKDINLFHSILPKIEAYHKDLYSYVIDYLKSNRKLLPVIIQGGSSSLSQDFLAGLERALCIEGLDDFMPDTHFASALAMIDAWEMNYPETYSKLQSSLNQPLDDFKLKLKEYCADAYEQFTDLYPALTSGGTFNPFLGFNVVDLYTKVIANLKSRGFDGVFVVYDEFSKFLEAGIAKVSSMDIRLLQDFAEKCNRSGANQMHILLISHKEISNYIDKLPKTKVDGWRGVSERFKHIELRNNYSQIYEIIATVIEKDKDYFDAFYARYAGKFHDMEATTKNRRTLAELAPEEYGTVIKGCYPLHPISTFILPRLSEKVAQNERTLFTFLSSNNKHTLSEFLREAKGPFPVLTPEYIYDYFEQQFKKEPYISDTYKIWQLASRILDRINEDALGCRIIKTLALIYVVDRFEVLPPTPDTIIDTFKESVEDISQITETLRNLQDKQYVVYQKRTNHYLCLKRSTGMDIGKMIAELAEKNRAVLRVKDIINAFPYERYLYPVSYNDNHEIMRYFNFSFIESDELLAVEHWAKRIESSAADGVVFGVLVKNREDSEVIIRSIEERGAIHDCIVFIVPHEAQDIDTCAYEYHAAKLLAEQFREDDAFVEELAIYVDDLEGAINEFVSGYTRPETKRAVYYYQGEQINIYRKSQVSALLSEICTRVFRLAPIINNESINKNFPEAVALNSRNKVVAGLLSTVLEPNLGLLGTSQDVSIMRSTIINMGILSDPKGKPQLSLSGISDPNMQHVLTEISNFLVETASTQATSFDVLYTRLTAPEYHIGLKRGVIPLYIAVVLHSLKQHVVITRGGREIDISAELLASINENPREYYAYLENWTKEKDKYIKDIEALFAEYVVEREKEYNTFNYVARAMQRWFISLPKYAKEMKATYQEDGRRTPLSNSELQLMRSLKAAELNARDYLFGALFDMFSSDKNPANVLSGLSLAKETLDHAKSNLIRALSLCVRKIFSAGQSDQASLRSVLMDWYEGLSKVARNHLYANGEEQLLSLISMAPNDESTFIERIAKNVVGLRIDDWEDATIGIFQQGLERFKASVDRQDKPAETETSHGKNLYHISFVDDQGEKIQKTFSRVSRSERARLLESELLAMLDDYGQALTEGEKRQVLMDVIEGMCRS